MSKYIIDTETWANLFEVQRVGVYGIGNDIVTDEKTVWSRMFSIDELEELNSDYINEHFGSLQDEAYQRGLNDAWEAARKIVVSTDYGGIASETLLEIFGMRGYSYIMQDNTAQEAIDKIKAYEDKQKDRIEVGDIVERYVDGKLDSKGIYLQEDGDYWRCLFDTGAVLMTFAYPKGQFKKTGKHYDIQSILEAMRK